MRRLSCAPAATYQRQTLRRDQRNPQKSHSSRSRSRSSTFPVRPRNSEHREPSPCAALGLNREKRGAAQSWTGLLGYVPGVCSSSCSGVHSWTIHVWQLYWRYRCRPLASSFLSRRTLICPRAKVPQAVGLLDPTLYCRNMAWDKVY